MKRIILFLFFVSLLQAQKKIDLDAALRMCNRDSNLYLKAEAEKLGLLKPGAPVKSVSPEYLKAELDFKKRFTDLWLLTWFEGKKAEMYIRHYRETDSMVKQMTMKNIFTTNEFQQAQLLSGEYFLKMNKSKALFSNNVRTLKSMLNTNYIPDFTSLSWIEKYKMPSLSYDSIAKLVRKNRPELMVKSNSKTKQKILQNELNTAAQNDIDLFTIYFANLQFSYVYASQADNNVSVSRTNYLNRKSGVLDFIEGEKNYFKTRSAYFECLYDFFKTKSDVLFSTGLITELLK